MTTDTFRIASVGDDELFPMFRRGDIVVYDTARTAADGTDCIVVTTAGELHLDIAPAGIDPEMIAGVHPIVGALRKATTARHRTPTLDDSPEVLARIGTD